MNTSRTIRNCTISFKFECPKRWEELSITSVEKTRFCNMCKSDVFFCETDEETIAHAKAGNCIARVQPDGNALPALTMGRPSVHAIPTAVQLEALAWAARERAIDDSIANATSSERSCTSCGYPAPNWRKTCRVCGLEMGRVADSGA